MKKTILMVDDEPANLALLGALLAPEGYNLVKAKNGEEALKYLSDNVPDLILLDIMMPGISGFSVLIEIRKDERTKTVPVILLTSLTDREDRIKGIDAGADDYISKPFDKAEFVFKVRTQMGLSVLRRQINEKEKLISVMELMLEGAAVTDYNFNIQQMNNTAVELLGIKDPHGNFADFLLEKHGHVIERETEKGEFIIGRPETTSRPPLFLSVEYRKVAQPNGDKGTYVFIFRDVTEEHTRKRMKVDFLSLISHKLRTPLTVISGYSKMLGAFAPDEKLKDMVEAIIRNSGIMENLIKRILYFVEIENTSRIGSLNPLNLREITDRFALLYKKPCELITDRESVNVKYWQATAAEELISNAFKFNDKEKLVLNVQVDADGLTVEDNGPGIPAAEYEKVFETFYQISKNSSGNTAGVGLGLSIVKRLTESVNRVVKLEPSRSGGLKVVIGKKPTEINP